MRFVVSCATLHSFAERLERKLKGTDFLLENVYELSFGLCGGWD